MTSLRLEGETADVKVPSQHLSGMVEENHGNPVELISLGSDSNMGLLRCAKYIIVAVSERAKAVMVIIQLCIKILSNETHQPFNGEN